MCAIRKPMWWSYKVEKKAGCVLLENLCGGATRLRKKQAEKKPL